MKPTYEELEARVQLLEGLLKKALERIAELEERLNRNSKNSHKPPSTDKKSNTTDDGHKKERKGHPGVARALFPSERIDNHVTCSQTNCPYCSSSRIQPLNQPPGIWQQAELPEVKAFVTEYALLKYKCTSCNRRSIARLPDGIPYSAFGPKLMGLLATLTGVFHLAKREAIQLVKDLYGVDVGVGSIPNIEERVANALDPVYHRIHSFVIENSFCKYFDETGWRDSGKQHFGWLASCPQAVCYRIDRRRNFEAFQKLIKGRDPSEFTAVTDRYSIYSRIKQHQYCFAHIIREFRLYAERDGPDKEIGAALVTELAKACKTHRFYREGTISLTTRNQCLGRCKRKVKFLLEDGMANGSDELYRLCDRLLEKFDKLWTFAKISDVDPTNNLAERDLRKLVLWRKKSYGTRSERGKRFVERISTIAQTARKQCKNVLQFIGEAIVSFYSKSDAPFVKHAMGF